MKSALKSGVRGIFHHAGGTWLTRFRSRSGVRILMYHRFPPASEFEAQCEHLKKYYRPASMTEVGGWLEKKGDIPPYTVVVTVDDGYRDFLVNAFPILQAYSIPAMVYLATDMIDRQDCLWVDWVKVLYRAAARDGADRMKESLKDLPNAERLAKLQKLPGELGLTAPPPIPEELRPLSWEEARSLTAAGIEFGAHTKSHPILSRLEKRSQICDELAGSKGRIEQETGQPVRHFCYPNGRPQDYTPEVIDVVRECGFVTAVTGLRGINVAGGDPYQLRRIHQDPAVPAVQFAHQVAGITRSR